MAACQKIGSYLPIFLLVVASVCAVTQVVLSKDMASLESTHGRDLGAGEALPNITPDEMAYKVSSSIVIMATVIVIFSVCMEKFIMEPLKDEEEENLKPIINTMFSELTLLGFVGLFMFIVEKLDLLSAPSYHIFRDKETLAELFEDVHMVVFLVMVLFLLNAFCLLKMGRATQKRWHEANLLCQGENKQRVISDYADKLRDGKPIPEELDFRLSFMALRERFIEAREREERKRSAAIDAQKEKDACKAAAGSKTDETPKKKPRVAKKADFVPHDFDLAHYFGKRMGETSGEIIEVPVATWFCLELFLIVLWALQLPLDSFQFSMLFIGVGYLMMFMAYMIDSHLKTVLGQLIPPIHYEKARRVAQLPAGTNACDHEISSLKNDGKFAAVSIDEGELHVPPFELSSVEDIISQHGKIKRFLFGELPSKQENLFFGGAMGESILTTCIRLEALGSAIYIAIFFVMMLNPILEKLEGRTALLAVVLVLAFVPVVVNFFALSVMISDFVIVTSVEELKNKKDIIMVKRAMVTKKAMTALKLLNTMRNSLPSISGDQQKKTPEEVWPDMETRVQKRIDMKDMFDLFDTSGDGSIDDKEFNSILMMMKIGNDPEDRARIYNELDEDGEGGISFEEFFHWIASHSHSEAEELNEHDLKEMAEQLFDMIDKVDPETGEKDGEISPAEFYETVSKLGRGKDQLSLTLEDVEALFKGVDEDGDGLLDAEEFENMLKKYMFDE